MSQTRRDPAVKGGAALTLSDSATFTATRGIHVNVGGTAVVVFADDASTPTTTSLVLTAGLTYPYSIVALYSTGTDVGVSVVPLR